MQAIFLEDEGKINSFVASISKPRLTKYLQESGGKMKDALLLYHWNSQLSQALYLPLQSWEIALRNKLNDFLCFKYGPNWPYDPRAVRNLTGKDARRLQETIGRQTIDRNGVPPTTNQIVADLSAGFWVSQLGTSYAVPYGWHNNLKWRVFTNDQTMTREVAAGICNDLLDLRNRVAHHEPIFLRPLDAMKADLDDILNALCAGTAAYMASACSFAEIWAAKPGTQILLGEIEPKKIEGASGTAGV
ncbi:MAG TPA: Abi family protein [Allosphingosinicella sp.]|nr:Abi family protein [Allosphingosinicella sp.]